MYDPDFRRAEAYVWASPASGRESGSSRALGFWRGEQRGSTARIVSGIREIGEGAPSLLGSNIKVTNERNQLQFTSQPKINT